MRTLQVTMAAAVKAYKALGDDQVIFNHLKQISSNSFELIPDEEGIMDEEQLEFEVMHQLCSAGVDESDFWFDGEF